MVVIRKVVIWKEMTSSTPELTMVSFISRSFVRMLMSIFDECLAKLAHGTSFIRLDARPGY